MQTLANLSADIVPHRLWAISKWFYANRMWYYHKISQDDRIVINSRFYQLVDPELRELCRVLHEHGLTTTPSCQGHNYEDERFEKIWWELVGEEKLIKTSGLEVRDSETDEPFLFKDESYELPWTDYETFLHAAADHQGIGYIGIVVPPERGHLAVPLHQMLRKESTHEISKDDRLGQILGGEYFQIFVTSQDQLVRSLTWRQLTEALAHWLEKASATGRHRHLSGRAAAPRDIPAPPT